ncbi:hypothetical protein CS006_10410 [Bifidobacterium primatium]|uniref:Head fiber protein n=1 Tax=Bifidobacterium primatium TaxID=2045438 RepID=A0A2M9H6A1_9BIFI|nr:head fiber protein [Bifidobacterium primatium]PJM72340.1 hypothetical protein CS006_10410 [Bifidobacterium primatium]
MSQAVEFHHLASGVTNDAHQAVIETQFLDDDGNPVDITGGSSTPSTPADGSITSAMLAAGAVNTAAIGDGQVTAAKLAKGVIPTVPAAPTADTLSGATATGRAVLKATDAAAARTAIGAGTPYTLPAAGTALGGVKRAAYVADPAGDAPTKAEFIALRDALVAAGIMAPKS